MKPELCQAYINYAELQIKYLQRSIQVSQYLLKGKLVPMILSQECDEMGQAAASAKVAYELLGGKI